MSQCVVPKWNLRPQRQEQVEGEEGNRSSHVHIQQRSPSHGLVHMSNHEVTELTWENGQLAMHGFGGFHQPTAQTKPTWNRAGDTLESIVHQATCHKPNMVNSLQPDHNLANISFIVASSGGGNSGHVLATPGSVRKRTRTRTESDQCTINLSSSVQEERMDRSVCASGSKTFCRDMSDRTMMTWASFESPRSFKTKTTVEDSTCHDGSESRDDRETKGETGRSHSKRHSRAAAIHNQSERRRRDRINQKMKALQKLVPNSSKTDKASMLDEVIDYLKQLQAQIQMMNNVRNMPQMMLPMGIQQQQLQMSLLARIAGMGAVGLGMGMGMVDMSAMARTAPQSLAPLMHPSPVAAAATPSFVQPPFVMPPMIPMRAPSQPSSDHTSSVPMHDPYCALLAQSMNMDTYSKMAALYRQQVCQTTTQGTSNPSQSNHDQRN